MDPDIGPPGGLATAVAELLRDSDVSISDIARRLGISRNQVYAVNRRAALRPPGARRRAFAGWRPERRAAVLRLLAVPDLDPADLTEALGFAPSSAPVLLAAFGLGRKAGRRGAGVDRGGETMPPRRLRALLRAHIGRQIGAFDAALADPRAGFDSAKVLRDLGGLKRLLDDLGPEAGERDGDGEGASHDPSTGPGRDAPLDLAALRAEIARRYERFGGGGAAA